MTFWRAMRVRRWRTRRGVSCWRRRSLGASRTARSARVRGWAEQMQQRQCLIFSVSAALSSTLMKDSVVSCSSSTWTYWFSKLTSSSSSLTTRQECSSSVLPQFSPTHFSNSPFRNGRLCSGAIAKTSSYRMLWIDRIGLTNSSTKGRPPFSMRTSMSSRPPEWNRISTSSFSLPGQKSLKIRFSISSCRLPSVNFLPLTIHGVCERYRENFMYLPQRQTFFVIRDSLWVTVVRGWAQWGSMPRSCQNYCFEWIRWKMLSNSGCRNCMIFARLWALHLQFWGWTAVSFCPPRSMQVFLPFAFSFFFSSPRQELKTFMRAASVSPPWSSSSREMTRLESLSSEVDVMVVSSLSSLARVHLRTVLWSRTLLVSVGRMSTLQNCRATSADSNYCACAQTQRRRMMVLRMMMLGMRMLSLNCSHSPKPFAAISSFISSTTCRRQLFWKIDWHDQHTSLRQHCPTWQLLNRASSGCLLRREGRISMKKALSLYILGCSKPQILRMHFIHSLYSSNNSWKRRLEWASCSQDRLQHQNFSGSSYC